jgi:cysteinyl-tRNA synthetase
LFVEGQKMSKSAGTFLTVRDVLARGYDGRQLRYVLMSTHYRKELNFTWDSLEAARTAIARIDAWAGRVKAAGASQGMCEEGVRFLAAFREALADDLNISGALGHFFDLIRDTNRALDEGKNLPGLAEVWQKVDSVLALDEPKVEVPEEIRLLLEQRQAARKNKDFKLSDTLRDEIKTLGWEVKDTPKGQEARRV